MNCIIVDDEPLAREAMKLLIVPADPAACLPLFRVSGVLLRISTEKAKINA